MTEVRQFRQHRFVPPPGSCEILLVRHGESRPHVVVAATHDAELVGLLAGLYDPWHFTDTVTDGGLAFNYRIEPGAATTRNAIALLALHGAPADVVTRALASAETIERQRKAGSV